MSEVITAERADAHTSWPGDGRAGLTVLIVEDDADSARSYEVLLRLVGHQVRVARNGPTALRLATELPPDVALIDIGLPGMDGWEVARQLRRQSPDRRPFLVALTGYGRPEDDGPDAAGMDLHLLKPVDPDQLLKLLRRFEQFLMPAARQ